VPIEAHTPEHIGFTDPRQRRERRRAVALAQLIATIALLVSIAVSATVVSIGIARASGPPLTDVMRLV
jgi:hypothetical protein